MIKSRIVAKLAIQTEQNITMYTASNNASASFLSLNSSISKDLTQITDKELKLTLLKSGPIKVLADNSSKFITQVI